MSQNYKARLLINYTLTLEENFVTLNKNSSAVRDDTQITPLAIIVAAHLYLWYGSKTTLLLVSANGEAVCIPNLNFGHLYYYPPQWKKSALIPNSSVADQAWENQTNIIITYSYYKHLVFYIQF